MKSSKIWLVILLLLTLILCNCPRVTNAAEQQSEVDFSMALPSPGVSYVCVQLKDFPLGILWRLKNMASAIKQEIPRGLQVGREKKKDQGYLLFSYQKRSDGVLLSMSFQRLADSRPMPTTMDDDAIWLYQQRVLNNPSSGMITDTLRELFLNFRLAWEKNAVPAGEEEIVLSGKKLDRTS